MRRIKGSVVFSPRGRGVLVDRDTAAGEWLVRLDRGTELDTSHGLWFPDSSLADTGGFRGEALVWWAGHMVPAADVESFQD